MRRFACRRRRLLVGKGDPFSISSSSSFCNYRGYSSIGSSSERAFTSSLIFAKYNGIIFSHPAASASIIGRGYSTAGDQTSSPAVQTVTKQQLEEKLDRKKKGGNHFYLIDVRLPQELQATGSIETAINIPCTCSPLTIK